MRKLPSAIAVMASAALLVTGCAGKTKTVTLTKTVTVTASAPSPSATPSPTAAPGTPKLVGDDISGPACSVLTAAEVSAASGNSIDQIEGIPNPLNHSDTCTWFLTPVPSCACARVSVTIVWDQTPAHDAGFRTLWDSDIAAHRAIRIPGIKDSELGTGTTGLSTTASFLKPGLWITVQSRQAYTWVAGNKDVLLKVVPLVYQRAKAGKDQP